MLVLITVPVLLVARTLLVVPIPYPLFMAPCTRVMLVIAVLLAEKFASAPMNAVLVLMESL